ELAREILRWHEAPLARPQDVQGDGRRKAFLEEALVRGGVVEGKKPLMRLVKLVGRPGQGQLVVIQTPLDVEMRFHQVHVALPRRTHNCLVVNGQPGTDALKDRK